MMSINTYRCVYTFVCPDGSTFDELFYSTSSSAAGAAPIGGPYIASRLLLLQSLCRLMYLRVSNVSINRDTYRHKFGLFGTAVSETAPDTGGNTAYCQLQGVGGSKRKLELRGLPDDYIVKANNTGIDQPPAIFLKVLNAFFKAAATVPFGIRTLQPVGAGLLAARGILQIQGGLRPGTSLVTLDQPAAYPVGSRVVVARTSAKDLPGLNAHYQVIGVGGALVTINYVTPQNGTVIGGQGTMRQEVFNAPDVLDYSNCYFDYYGTRKTRSVFTNSRGARRAVRLRLSL